jgi:Domain of unknown function (DUF1844)
MKRSQMEDGVDEKGSEDKVKVVDRRWFTAEGDPRRPEPDRGAAQTVTTNSNTGAAPGSPPPTTAVETASPPAPPTPGPSEVPRNTPGSSAAEPELLQPGAQPSFVDLVDSLAQPAVAFLSGQVPGRGRDLAAARHYIDLLAVLEAKTRGNLSFEEKSVLDDVLYQLRSLFVAGSR